MLFKEIKVLFIMKKEKNNHYDKQKILNNALKFLESNEKLMTIEYRGKELNSIYGIFGKDYKEVKIPLKFYTRYLFKRIFQRPILKMIQGLDGTEFKNKVYRFLGLKIGREVSICPGVFIDDLLPELITINDGTIIGRDVKILTHEFTIKHMRFGRINIGKQVTIGNSSIIRSGVTIGNGAVIAMDSLVNKDVLPKEEVGGIPIHRIKKLKKLI